MIGVGVGPGDPELLTLKAVKAIAAADVVAFFAKAGNPGVARMIVEEYLPPQSRQLPLLYPVTTEIDSGEKNYVDAIARFFDEAAAAIAAQLDAGRCVAVLSEGDPLFYGSYMHVHVRLAPRYRTEIIPGVSGMSGCWSMAGLPLVQGDDVLSVLPGTLCEEDLSRHLAGSDGAVIMKVGRNLAKIRRALLRAGKLANAIYVERGTMSGAAAMKLVDKADDLAPYFAVVLVPGWERRP